jgi:hypothetical protein
MDAFRYLDCLTAWTIRPSPRSVVVEDGVHRDPRLLVQGPPAAVLRWLWAGPATTR